MKFHLSSSHVITLIILLTVMLAGCSLPQATTAAQKPTEIQPPQKQEAPTATPLPKPSSTPVPTKTTAPTATPKPVEPGTSRSNPLPLNTEFKGKDWSIVITGVIRGQEAAAAITKANKFNKPAEKGFEYIIANLKITNISEKQEAQSTMLAVDLRLTGDRNIVYNNASVVAPKSFEDKLFPKGTSEGQEIFMVPSDEKNLMFMLGEALSMDSKSVRFYAIESGSKVVPDPALKNIKPTDLGKKRDAPAKVGETVIAGGYEVTILETVRGDKARDLIKQANQFNNPADPGKEYVAIKVKIRYLGDKDADSRAMISGASFQITGEKNVVYDSVFVVAPDPQLDATLFAGGETNGWTVLVVEKDEKKLLVIFQPFLSFSNDDIRYISID